MDSPSPRVQKGPESVADLSERPDGGYPIPKHTIESNSYKRYLEEWDRLFDASVHDNRNTGFAEAGPKHSREITDAHHSETAPMAVSLGSYEADHRQTDATIGSVGPLLSPFHRPDTKRRVAVSNFEDTKIELSNARTFWDRHNRVLSGQPGVSYTLQTTLARTPTPRKKDYSYSVSSSPRRGRFIIRLNRFLVHTSGIVVRALYCSGTSSSNTITELGVCSKAVVYRTSPGTTRTGFLAYAVPVFLIYTFYLCCIAEILTDKCISAVRSILSVLLLAVRRSALQSSQALVACQVYLRAKARAWKSSSTPKCEPNSLYQDIVPGEAKPTSYGTRQATTETSERLPQHLKYLIRTFFAFSSGLIDFNCLLTTLLTFGITPDIVLVYHYTQNFTALLRSIDGDLLASWLTLVWTALCKEAHRASRPAIRDGFTRIEWHCTCGKLLWGDYREGREGSIQTLANALGGSIIAGSAKRGPYAASGSESDRIEYMAAGEDKSTNMSSPRMQSAQASQGHATRFVSTTASFASSTSLPGLSSSSTALSSSNTYVHRCCTTKRYLEVCVRSGRDTFALGEIDISGPQTDRTIFTSIRRKYNEKRDPARLFGRFVLRRPVGGHFVMFRKDEIDTVSIMARPSVPPECEVKSRQYHYDPVPMDEPVMDSRTFNHYFHKNHKAHSQPRWFPRFPQKLESSLLCSMVPLAKGWGVEIEEERNWTLFCVVMLIALLLSGMVAGLSAWLMHDTQSGIAIGAWLTTVQTLAATAAFFHWAH